MDPATPKPGETGTPKAPENVTPTSAPAQGNASDPAVEQLRKEKEQAEMRANQLANQLKAREEAEAAAKAKELEENNEFKTLHEQEKAKNVALQAQIDADKAQKELEGAKAKVLADYSDEVKAVAKEFDVDLSSADDDATAAFKGKLDKIQLRVGTSGKVTPNNPGAPSTAPAVSGVELGHALKDQSKFEEIISKRPGLAAMMTPKR
jgi:membrane protein involved in colicin uptake